MIIPPTIAALVPGKSGAFAVVRDGELLVAISAPRAGGWYEGGDLCPGRVRALVDFATDAYGVRALVWRTLPPAPTTPEAQATIDAEANAWRLQCRRVGLPVVGVEVDRGHREPLHAAVLGRTGTLNSEQRTRLSLAWRLASNYALELSGEVEAALIEIEEGKCAI